MRTKPAPGFEHFDSFYENIRKDKEGEWRNELCTHLKPILQKYPDYEPDEYVLWINEMIFIPFPYKSLSVKLVLLDENETELQGLADKICVGKVVKTFAQMRLRNGRSMIHGVPLRFKTFEELNRIKTVQVTWEIELDVQGHSVVLLHHVPYKVNFVPDEHKRFYQIYDEMPCNFAAKCNDTLAERFRNWLRDFESVTEVNGSFNKNSKVLKPLVDKYHLNIEWQQDKIWFVTICRQTVKLKPADYVLTDTKCSDDEDLSQYQKFIDYHDTYYK